MEKNIPTSIKDGFAGRKEEKRLFSAYLNSVISGKSVCVMVIGPPGMGKSALLREYAGMAKEAGSMVIDLAAGKNESEEELTGKLKLETERKLGLELPDLKGITEELDDIKKRLLNEHNGMVILLDDFDNLAKAGDILQKMEK